MPLGWLIIGKPGGECRPKGAENAVGMVGNNR
jgi:hypothetical protein